MTDLEMTRRCAEGMGLAFFGGSYEKPEHWIGNYETMQSYDPLHDDAQAMALVKRFRLVIGNVGEPATWCVNTDDMQVTALNLNLNRAIVECVANMRELLRVYLPWPPDSLVARKSTVKGWVMEYTYVLPVQNLTFSVPIDFLRTSTEISKQDFDRAVALGMKFEEPPNAV